MKRCIGVICSVIGVGYLLSEPIVNVAALANPKARLTKNLNRIGKVLSKELKTLILELGKKIRICDFILVCG